MSNELINLTEEIVVLEIEATLACHSEPDCQRFFLTDPSKKQRLFRYVLDRVPHRYGSESARTANYAPCGQRLLQIEQAIQQGIEVLMARELSLLPQSPAPEAVSQSTPAREIVSATF
ncbi:MAG: hypothetical protein AAGG02_18625 [Cyanobacteria bacterium P01_H01_bin.15]